MRSVNYVFRNLDKIVRILWPFQMIVTLLFRDQEGINILSSCKVDKSKKTLLEKQIQNYIIVKSRGLSFVSCLPVTIQSRKFQGLTKSRWVLKLVTHNTSEVWYESDRIRKLSFENHTVWEVKWIAIGK